MTARPSHTDLYASDVTTKRTGTNRSTLTATVLLAAPWTAAAAAQTTCPESPVTWEGFRVCPEDTARTAREPTGDLAMFDDEVAASANVLRSQGRVWTPYSCTPFDLGTDRRGTGASVRPSTT